MDYPMINIQDLDPRILKFGIKIKVLRIEEQIGRRSESGCKVIELIVADEKGDRIGIQVGSKLKSKFGAALIQENSIYIVSNLSVDDNIQPTKFRSIHWNHEYKLMFTSKTVFTPITADDWNGLPMIEFVPFTDLIDHKLDAGVSIDVIGRVNRFDDLKPKGRSTHINFELIDLSDRTVSCTLWNDFARTFDSYMRSIGPDSCAIIIIQFAKTNDYNGTLTVSSDWTFSKVSLNTDEPEINAFRSSLFALHGDVMSSGKLAPTLTPSAKEPKSWFAGCEHVALSQLSPDKIGMYVVHATILSILRNPPWFYVACKKCNRKPKPTESLDDLTSDIDTILGRRYSCQTKCGPNPKVGLRYRVPIRVADSTGTASFTLFESDIEKFIPQSAYQLTKALVADEDIPTDFDALIGKTLLFKFEINQNNQLYSSFNYTVKEVRADSQTLKHFREKYNLPETEDDGATVNYDPSNKPEDDGTTVNSDSSKKAALSFSGDTVYTVQVNSTNDETPPRKRMKEEILSTPSSVRSSSSKPQSSLESSFLV